MASPLFAATFPMDKVLQTTGYLGAPNPCIKVAFAIAKMAGFTRKPEVISDLADAWGDRLLGGRTSLPAKEDPKLRLLEHKRGVKVAAAVLSKENILYLTHLMQKTRDRMQSHVLESDVFSAFLILTGAGADSVFWKFGGEMQWAPEVTAMFMAAVWIPVGIVLWGERWGRSEVRNSIAVLDEVIDITTQGLSSNVAEKPDLIVHYSTDTDLLGGFTHSFRTFREPIPEKSKIKFDLVFDLSNPGEPQGVVFVSVHPK